MGKTTDTSAPSADNPNVATFATLFDVVKHLKAAGFKAPKSKVYRDRDKGMIRVNPDGTVPETEVRAYAATLDRVAGDIGDLNDIHAQKTAREVQSLELKIKKQQFELARDQGRYILRSDFEAEMAARAAVLESGFRHLFDMRVREWISLVGGRPDRAADLLLTLNKALDDTLTGYATTKTFQVIFTDADNTDT